MATIQELKAAVDAAQTLLDTAQEIARNAEFNKSILFCSYREALKNYNDAVAAGIQQGTVGSISSVSSLLLAERNAGIQGAAEFIKANPEGTQEQVIEAWTTSAKAATNLPALLQDPNVLFMLYATNLQQMGAITDTTWASVLNWIIATPLEVILAD